MGIRKDQINVNGVKRFLQLLETAVLGNQLCSFSVRAFSNTHIPPHLDSALLCCLKQRESWGQLSGGHRICLARASLLLALNFSPPQFGGNGMTLIVEIDQDNSTPC